MQPVPEADGLFHDVIRIDGIYYDTKCLATTHPGGDIMVLMSNKQDGTTLFNSSHRRAFPHNKWKQYVVDESKVAPGSKLGPMTQDFSLYFQLCEKVKPILAKSGGFAPTWTYVKFLILFSVVLGVDLCIVLGYFSVYTLMIQSLFMAWIGLQVQHDANHGAVSKSPLVNRILGLGQDLIGGSSLSWMINHNTIHHVFCNDVQKDHDLDIVGLRLKKNVEYHAFYQLQQYYFLILEALFGPFHMLYNFVYIWTGPRDREKVFGHHWFVNRCTSLILPIRLLFLYLHSASLAQAVFFAFAQSCPGGLYLAFFFILSHNFVGVKKEEIDATKGCFVRNQTETSCNVAGYILAHFNGGLNFQIEHHLFPRVHSSHYYKLAPIVRETCEKAGIKYVHYPTIWENFESCRAHLKSLGEGSIKA